MHGGAVVGGRALDLVEIYRTNKIRKEKQSSGDHHDYGLPSGYKTSFPTIASELEDFFT